VKYRSEGYYHSELLDLPNIIYGFGTRLLDNLDCFSLDRLGIAMTNKSLRGGQGTTKQSSEHHVVIPKTKQVHGSDVVVFETVDPNKTYIADAFLSGRPGIICKVRTADCLPMIIFDPVKKIVGAVHCGWRSTVARIVPSVFDVMSKMGSHPKDVVALIGPHILADCYEVGEALTEVFCPDEWPVDALFHEVDGKSYFSLQNAVLYELERCGVLEDHIDVQNLCTHCHPEQFYSYRREPSERGRQSNFISINSKC